MTRAAGKHLRRREKMVQDATPLSLRQDVEANEKDGKLDVGFYNAQDGQKGRDGGPYLDHVERQAAEIHRAKREGRDPEDLEGALPPAVGTSLRVAGLVVDNPFSNPSMAQAPGLELKVNDDTYGGDPNLADPIQVLPVDFSKEAPEDTGEDVAGNTVPESGSPDIPESGPSVSLPQADASGGFGADR